MKLATIAPAHVRKKFITRKELKATSEQDWSWVPKMEPEFESKSGVYAVFFWSDKREKWYVYVGQSGHIGHRLKFHCSVNKRAYPNRKYMNAAKKYAASVRVRILETCEPDDMPRVERKWLKATWKHVEPQMRLNVREDNVETNRGLSNEWVKEQWKSNPEYRKKMRAALRRGTKKRDLRLQNDKALRKSYADNAIRVAKNRKEQRATDPSYRAHLTMRISKAHCPDLRPVKVANHCFGSYADLARAMRCSRRVATRGWKEGGLYGFKIKEITWKEYLQFYEDVDSFQCKELRKPMTPAQAAALSKAGGYDHS